jgi:Ca2+-transporting ATPase
MILLLLAVIGISIGIEHFTDAMIISSIVVLNAWIGFFQEFRAEKAMESIRHIAAPGAKVVRDGKILKIPAREVVPGDIVHLEAGDRIPADLRFAEANLLQADESLLSGESTPVFKETVPLHETDLTIGDQANIGFTGTLVVGGRGVGIVVGTGQKTEFGRIASLLSTNKKGETPLKQRLEKVTRQLVLAAFFLCFVLFGIGLLRGEAAIEMLLAAMSLGIASIPEGLPAVITISLSLGSLRLAKQGALIRQLSAVEGLGSITVICADKTGTLTQNRMAVRYPKIEIQTSPFFIDALILCNDASFDFAQGVQLTHGDPMEIALLKFANEKGQDVANVRKKWKRISEIPFDTERKWMSTVNESDGRRILYMKGAPEKVISLCKLSLDKRQELEVLQEKLASQGLRILAVAMQNHEPIEQELTFLGLVGLQDPPRQEAKVAIAECRAAGIRPVMITGDYQTTAVAIARELGVYQQGDEVITGADLKRKNREWLDERSSRASVFARVSPEDKFSIIQMLKDRNEFVAMTGDGVNDAPALRIADVGIAMGRGTDVAKEASSLILVEESFSTIVHAVREGRVIYDNIRKFVRYMLTTNLAEIVTMLLAAIAALPTPLLPVQILWINLVTDGLPAVALGYEPAEGNVMARRPRPTNENILGRGLWQHVLWVGVLMGCLTIILMTFFMKNGFDTVSLRTTVFTALTFAQMGHVLAIRQESLPLWKIGFFSNWRLGVAVLGTIGSQLLILKIPFLNGIFHVAPLSWVTIAYCFIPALVIYLAVEVEKNLKNVRMS